MPLAKKPRGATAIHQDKQGLPRSYLLAGLTLAAIALTVYLLPAEETAPVAVATEEEPVQPEPVEAVQSPTEPTPAAPTPAESAWRDQTVGKGDNLSLVFKRAGFNDRDVYRFVNKAPEGKSLGRLYPGQTISFLSDDSGELIGVRHQRSDLETITYSREGDKFDTEKEVRTPEVRRNWASGTIESSLFLAGQAAGLSNNMIMELANIFCGVIDFVHDPRQGDTMHLLYEELYLDGKKYGDGAIIAATFVNQGEAFNAFRYEDSKGDVG